MSLTREQLFRATNVVHTGPQVEPVTKQAMVLFEDNYWKKYTRTGTSFYASRFPGTDKSCGRKMLYSLMGVPEVTPMSPKLRGLTLQGKSAEYYLTHRWLAQGMMVGIKAPDHFGDEIPQIRLEDPDLWLSGAIDALLDMRPKWKHILPVEIKSKDQDVIKDMRNGNRSYDDYHFLQIQSYLYMCEKYHEKMGWDKLGFEPAIGGVIYYVSRQDPTFVREFYVPKDDEVINRAVENLKQFKQSYLEGKLPERPKEWKWSEEPCKWCPFKREACKKDWKEGITELAESNGIEFAKFVHPSYNYDKTRQGVLDRWTYRQLELF